MSDNDNSKINKPFEVTAKMIKAVRKETRAGALDCKHALEATDGNVEEAIKYLIKHGKSTPKINWI
jgi:translation elongation factor EF-Ts